MYSKVLGECGGASGGLGLVPAAIATAQSVAAMSGSVQSAWESLVGGDAGSHCWRGYGNRPFKKPCPNTPNYDWVTRAVTSAPESEIQKILYYLLKATGGSGPKSRADLLRSKCMPFWVKAILGGKGCVASMFPEAPEWFVSFVDQYGPPPPATPDYPGSGFIPAEGTARSMAALAAAGLALVFLPKLLKKGR